MLEGRKNKKGLEKTKVAKEKKRIERKVSTWKKMPSLLHSKNCSRYSRHDTNAQNAKSQTTKTRTRMKG